MSQKKNKNNNNTTNDAQNENKESNNNNNNSNSNKKEDETKATKIVMKIDMHCEGCSSKIIKCIAGFEGVEKIDKGDGTGKLTITGNIDAAKLRDKLVSKTKKKVEVISPPLKNNDKENKKSDNKNNKPDEKKPKELPFTTVTLKMELHCPGCIERIRKTVSKAKGVNHVAIDKEKETLTVKGTMDVKVLMEKLKKRFKRKIEVVQPKKEKEKDKDKDKENEKEGNKGEKAENDGGKKNNQNQKGGEGGNKKGDANVGGDNNAKMEVSSSGYGYGYGFWGLDYNNYGQVQMMQMQQAPQMFSDENPNACSIM
ncbi:unnamed protein product [Trifolium pratense]|uniref:Uncharacterized protein n=1 Tax=Trifolium pratense TaxID=57577 RepID=A0ACB0KWB9_TRIPR|nr:unnamed protein product [Trifolium pratense]